jgi:hypothetical protein
VGWRGKGAQRRANDLVDAVKDPLQEIEVIRLVVYQQRGMVHTSPPLLARGSHTEKVAPPCTPEQRVRFLHTACILAIVAW